MATQKEVAELAGVSFITVSRVINDMGNVKEETKLKVEAAIKKLNYYPSILGQGLNSGLIKTIGVLASIPEDTSLESNYYYTALLEGLETACRKKRFDLLLSTQRISDADFDYLRLYYQKKVDGMIYLGNTNFDKDVIGKIENERIPCVVIGDRPDSDLISYVDSNNIQGGYDCTNRLIKLGHKKIAFLSVIYGNLNIQHRLEGYLKALKENNIPVNDNFIGYGDFKEQSGYDFLKNIWNKKDKPTAIICGTDVMAMGVLTYAQENNISIPDDFSLIGFDAMDHLRFTSPKLNSNSQPLLEMGTKAAEFLFNRIEHPEGEIDKIVYAISDYPGESVSPPKK